MSLIYIVLEWFLIGECVVIGLWYLRGIWLNDKKLVDGLNLCNILRILVEGFCLLVYFFLVVYSCSDNLYFFFELVFILYLDCRWKIKMFL